MTQTQPSQKTAVIELVLEREYDAPMQAVYDAWTDPAQLVKWWGPEGMTLPLCEMDVREGGAYRTTMQSPDGKQFTVSGVYRELSPPSRLSFTWGWIEDGKRGHETLCTVELSERAGKTQMRFEQRSFESAESRDRHNEGWSSSFECLAQHLAT